MKKRIPIVILILAAAGVAVWAFRGMGKTNDNRLVLSGNIELTEITIAFKTAGRLMERTVDEGDAVKKGQVIARLDRDQLMMQRERETAGLAANESQLAQAQTAVEFQRASLAADLETRRADVTSVEARLAEMQNGARPQEKLDARAAVDAATSELERAKRDWDRAQTLYKNDDISTAQYDQFRNRFENAQAVLKQLQEREALVLAGPRAEQVNAQLGLVARTRGTVKMAEANTLELKRREQEIATRRAEIARSKASLALIDTQLADTVVASPVDGVVLVKAADAGEVLAPGTTVVTVGDIDHPWLRGYINETDLGKVKIGSKAQVTTDSYPGKVYNGRVTFIASQAEFTPKQIQTQQERVKLVYRVKIEVENPGRELKSNMPADAKILFGAVMDAIIEIHGLTKRFGGLTAVDHLDLTVGKGEIFGLVGPDGAGKTTTLRMLCGLMDPSEGSARVAGHDVARESRAVKDQIGYMAQRFGLYQDLTVEENMVFYADLFGITGQTRTELTAQLLHMTRMEPFRKRPAGQLSGGMKQKLALMCTLLHRPRILFLDEPTNGVDPVSRRDFWAILYQLLKDEITIFMTTSYLDEAERCNRVGLLHKGKLIRCSTPEAMKAETGSANLEGAFIQTIHAVEGLVKA